MNPSGGDWGSYIQGGDEWQKIDIAGEELSKHIPCHSIHYPAFNKRIFECRCGILFPAWQVHAAVESGDWTMIDQIHKGVKK